MVHVAAEAAVRLRTAGGATDSVVRQTYAYWPYQPGKGQLILLMGVLGAAAVNVRKRVGYFDASNGIYLEQDAVGGINIVQRSSTSGSVVNTSVASADWNIDPFDGTGPSGVTLDVTKAQILVIDLQWLGVGRVRVGFDVDGVLYYAHHFLNANAFSTVYMARASLPVRYEITNVGAPGGATNDLMQICCSVNSESGQDDLPGRSFTASNGATTINIATRRPILSVRPRTTFNSIVNRIYSDIKGCTFYVGSGADAFVEIVYGGTLTGAAFGNVDTSNSGMEFDVAATAITGGLVLDSFFASSSSEAAVRDYLSKLPLTLDAAGANPIILSVVATRIGAAVTPVSAGFTWTELR
jgi:hypothetical protein